MSPPQGQPKENTGEVLPHAATKTPDAAHSENHSEQGAKIAEAAKSTLEANNPYKLEVTSENLDTWTVQLEKKLRSGVGAQYTPDHLYAALRHIKYELLQGGNIFSSVKSKVEEHNSFTVELSEAVVQEIKTGAAERSKERGIIAKDWREFITMRLRPQKEAVKNEPKPEKTEKAPEAQPEKAPEPKVEKETAPDSTKDNPSLRRFFINFVPTRGDAKLSENIENVLCKFITDLLSSNLKPGQAVDLADIFKDKRFANFFQKEFKEIQEKISGKHIYIMKNREGEVLINGVGIKEGIKQLDNQMALVSDTYIVEGYEMFSADSYMEAVVDCVYRSLEACRQEIASLESEYDEYDGKEIDENYFDQLNNIAQRHPESIFMGFSMPFKINGIPKLTFHCQTIKTDSGFHTLTCINLDKKVDDAISNKVQAFLADFNINTAYPDIKALGQKFLNFKESITQN